jgi:hypothetical protein
MQEKTVFTQKQGQYLAFIYAYTKLNRRPPAEADMQRYFEVTPPSVHQMVIGLEKQGLVPREKGLARTIKILIGDERDGLQPMAAWAPSIQVRRHNVDPSVKHKDDT